MRRLLLASLLPLMLLTACGGGVYHLPRQDYQQQLKTLGVLPLLVDRGQAVRYPDPERLYALLADEVRGHEQQLVERLRKKKAYFDVRQITGSPDALALSLLAGSTTGEDGRHYRFDPAGVAAVAADHVVDGLLVVVLYGAERLETRRDRNLISYLDASYATIRARVAVLKADGTLAWEYPVREGYKFLDLEYPDFDEAYYNKTDQVKVKPITLEGLRRTLEEQESGLFSQSEYPKLFERLFDDLVSALEPGLF